MNSKFHVLVFTLFIILFLSGGVKAATPFTMTEGIVRFGENIYIQPNAVENSDVVSLGGDIYVNGRVNGDVVSVGGNVYINGSVNGNVTSVGGAVNIGAGGKVTGKITERAQNMNIPFHNNLIGAGNIKSGLSRVASFIFLSICSFVVYILMTQREIKMAVLLRRNIKRSFAYGYITMLLFPVIIFALILTLIGILFIPLLFLALFTAYMIGFTALSISVGRKIMFKFKQNASPIICMLIGILVYELIVSITFLNLGDLIYLFVIIPLCVGIALSSRFGSFKPWRKNYNEDIKIDWNKYGEE